VKAKDSCVVITEERQEPMERTSDLYSTILAHGPSPSTLLIILRKMKDEGRVREAVRECIKGLSLYPDDIRLRWLLAEYYLELGFFSMAEKEIALAAENVHKLAPIFKIQADLFERQGRREDASGALETYLAHFPGDTEVIERLQTIKQKEEISSSQAPPAEEIVSEIATHTLAEIYESQGQVQAAIDTYRKIIEHHPEDLKAREHLQQLEGGTGMHEGVESAEPLEKRQHGTQRMIGVLEAWLTSIQEMARA
jgi:tetratricopeptide (TPR) repeat protein